MPVRIIKIKKIILCLLISSFILVIGFLFIIFPAIILDKIAQIPSALLPLTLLKQTSIFAIFLFLPLLFKKSRILMTILSITSGFYYTVVYFFIAFWYFTRDIFNPYFFIDSYEAIIPTGILLVGTFLLIMIILSLIAIFLIFCYLFFMLYTTLFELKNSYHPQILKFKYLLLVPVFILPIYPNQGYLTYHYNIIDDAQKARNFFQPFFPTYTPDVAKSDDNIFILQLESGNALLLQGQAEIDNKKYNELYVPHLHQIAKDGIFFPYFWSNSMQTDRAQENILCGIADNIGRGFSQDINADLKTCLPHELKKVGYKTIAFRSDNLNYNNMGSFMKNLGYDEIHYADIMKPDDLQYKWGYDDCIFYQRAFEYLKKNYPDPAKLFVYFEVSAAHTPWDNHEQYSFAHKIKPAETYTEKYINAQSEQDYCLSKFYEEYKNYNTSKTHLFILSDTSSPVGLNNGNRFNFQNNFNENFLTYLLYIPPFKSWNEFQIGKMVSKLAYSHNDILPTIYELLGNQNYQNSFAYELKKDATPANHEDCQILSQPYSGGYLIVIKNNYKYLYSTINKTVTRTDLQTDIWEKNPKIVEENLSWQDFKDKYFCQRYK